MRDNVDVDTAARRVVSNGVQPVSRVDSPSQQALLGAQVKAETAVMGLQLRAVKRVFASHSNNLVIVFELLHWQMILFE